MRPRLTPAMAGDLTWQSPQEAWQDRQDFSNTFSSKIFASSFDILLTTRLRCPIVV
ncbi:MAG: hypothetical protein A4E67_01253 [Syntrophaceae bacterium PtaB.Bin038]|nr:MAG: hypothetical protein A4E67_01253 [Syntrophaceae bacterium PtaB.Bin038]